MGLFDKVKKAIGGGTPSAPSKGSTGGSGGSGSGGSGGGNRQGGQGGGNRQGGQGGTRQGGNRSGAADGQDRARGGNRQGGQGQGGEGQGGQRSQGGNRNRQGSQAQGEGGDRPEGSAGGNRRRGSRGGRGRGGQGGQGGERQGSDRPQGSTATDTPRDGDSGSTGEGGSSANRRRRGGRGRGRGGSGSGEGGSGGQGGTTRTVTRSNAAELKEQQEKDGTGGGGRSRSGGRSGGSRSGGSRSGGRSGGGDGRSGRSGGGKKGGGRSRERTRRGSASSGSARRVLDANERPKDPVKKQILINASDPNEIRVAIREQQTVVEVYVERKGKRSLAGNIYKGRVQNVLRGMEAAFVDIGLERNGFLYVDEITPAAADSDQIMKVSMATEVEAVPAPAAAETEPAADGEDGAAASADATGDAAPDMLPIGTPAEAMAIAAATNDETLDIGDAMEEEDREKAEAEEAEAKGEDQPKEKRSEGRGRARIQNKKKIQDLIKPGQEILCQVVKDPMGTKGSRLTTQYSLAGRYLVYVPDGEGMGVSRRLEDAERNRLRDIVKQFELPWGGGLIVRTAAEGALEEDIAKDLQLLLRLHEQLMDKAGQARAPKLLYNEADLSLRIIRDLMNDEVEEVLVDDDRQYQRIMNYLKRTSPILAERVRMHDGQRPLFESYGVEEAIRSTLSKRAELESGGYLIIDKTEAFHVIDVNTGRNVGTASLEETITKTNMEAAGEVVRQLRLRDLGGIIVVDFIDMNLMKNRDAVLEHFRKELSKDRTKTYLVEISPLGLVEMTRQNVSEGVREILTSTCRACEGRGVQVSAETHAIEVERAVVDLAAGLDADVEAVAIETQPDVARVLAGNIGKQAELNKRAGKTIRVFPDPDLTSNTFAVRATGDIAKVEGLPDPLLRGTKHKVLIERVDPSCEDDGLAMVDGVLVTVVGAGSVVGEERTILIAACAGGRAFATLVKPARRRRRRGGRGRRKATVGVGAVGADGLEDEDDLEDDGEDGEDGDFEDDAEYEDVEDDETEIPSDPVEDPDDERTEIPQRLVMLDGGVADEEGDGDDGEEADDDEDDERDGDGDDDADDDDDDDDDEDDDHDREGDDGDDDGSDDDSSSDGGDDASDSDSGSEPQPAGEGDVDDDDALPADDSDDGSDGDGTIDALSVAAVDHEDDDRPLARRAPVGDDHDEPSIDAEGGDDLLASRGVSVPAGTMPRAAMSPAATSTDDGEVDGEGEGAAATAAGTAARRRRRGSRGGRNRNRGGSGGGG
ncbi:MAG: RNAse, partial [Thermoleophilia bacterium]|nr:RNAse [Thermoleophilia bacterium]